MARGRGAPQALPGTLAGGEQKMLILARALMLRPRLLLIGEISEGLQPSVIDRIAGALRDERGKDGTAMLVVEQNPDLALRVADRWAVLKWARSMTRASVARTPVPACSNT